MFWKQARERYGQLTPDDPDIKKYGEIAADLQTQGYKGLAGRIQDMGHRWIARRTPSGRVLEIGFGAGRHASFYSRAAEDYFVSEYSERFMYSAAWQETGGRGVRCDATHLPFRSGVFRTVVCIYALEHIADLQRVAEEARRVLAPKGTFLVGLPCEGGLLWNVGRELTTRRIFMKRYGINYDKIIANEHVWDYPGVISEIESTGLFNRRAASMLPFRISSHHLNLIACLEYVAGE